MISYEIGDLFSGDCDAVGHGCNTLGVMDAGIARHFAERYPAMAEQYYALCQRGGFEPGDVFFYRSTNGKPSVLNLATQDNLRHASLAYLEMCCKKIAESFPEWGIHKLGLPRIGTGLGKLDWADVRHVLETHFAQIPDFEVVVYDNN
jgi:O-acetyl-ADP-ribose deacetylase (regulator of RNase III)